jgi:hypothetical protein
LWTILRTLPKFQRARVLTWDQHTEHIDILDFSNRNIPLKVTYKGTEPRWLWATYLYLRNTGNEDIRQEDIPDKQGFVVGGNGARYIGFNKLISAKAKVTLSPLFRGNDVYCKIDFDRLGPGDEIVVSLLYIAEEMVPMEVEGNLFGSGSRIINGYHERVHAWRSLWWLLVTLIAVGTSAGFIVNSMYAPGEGLTFQLVVLGVIYTLALATAIVLLRPIRSFQRLSEMSHGHGADVSAGRWMRFFFGLSKEP